MMNRFNETNSSIFKQIKSPLSLYLLYGLIFIISLIRLLPWNRIGILTVNGNEQLNSQDVIQWSELTPLHPKRATFKKTKLIEERLKEKSPLIETVQLEKEDSFHTTIIIKEATMIGQIKVDQEVYAVTQEGMLINSNESPALPTLLFEEEDHRLTDFFTSLGQIDNTLIEEFEYVQLTPLDVAGASVKIQCRNGDLIMTNIHDLSQKLPFYKDMKEQNNQKNGVYHLDVGAYYSPIIYSEDQLDLL